MKKRAPFSIAIYLLLCLPEPSISEHLETRFGPILYDTNEQIMEYGRSIRPLLSPAYRSKPPLDVIVSRHEYVFESVCEKLGIKLNDLKTIVRIVSSLKELRAEYKRLVPDGDMSVTAFYSHADKTIWYAQESLSRKLVIHETAHAVLDHYFIQPIPAGVDEIIAETLEKSN